MRLILINRASHYICTGTDRFVMGSVQGDLIIAGANANKGIQLSLLSLFFLYQIENIVNNDVIGWYYCSCCSCC